jgi:hypothetical protein
VTPRIERGDIALGRQVAEALGAVLSAPPQQIRAQTAAPASAPARARFMRVPAAGVRLQ